MTQTTTRTFKREKPNLLGFVGSSPKKPNGRLGEGAGMFTFRMKVNLLQQMNGDDEFGFTCLCCLCSCLRLDGHEEFANSLDQHKNGKKTQKLKKKQ